jgi:hypothetical protein
MQLNTPVPDELLEPVSFWLPVDYEENDINKLVQKQAMIEDIICGKAEVDDILDFLNDEDEESPDDYMDAVIESLENSPLLYA